MPMRLTSSDFGVISKGKNTFAGIEDKIKLAVVNAFATSGADWNLAR